jgi:hypothetical protein
MDPKIFPPAGEMNPRQKNCDSILIHVFVFVHLPPGGSPPPPPAPVSVKLPPPPRGEPPSPPEGVKHGPRVVPSPAIAMNPAGYDHMTMIAYAHLASAHDFKESSGQTKRFIYGSISHHVAPPRRHLLLPIGAPCSQISLK